MADFATALKAEILRLARKEAKAATAPLRKAASQYRRDIAELKRQVAEQAKRIAFLERHATTEESPPDDTEGLRFSVRSLKANRRKTGLSQADYARLIGVTPLTIYNWESGRTRPNPTAFAKLVSIRGLGKRDAQRRLELLE